MKKNWHSLLREADFNSVWYERGRGERKPAHLAGFFPFVRPLFFNSCLSSGSFYRRSRKELVPLKEGASHHSLSGHILQAKGAQGGFGEMFAP